MWSLVLLCVLAVVGQIQAECEACEDCVEQEMCSGRGDPVCTCDAGWTGEWCDQEMDWCAVTVQNLADKPDFESLCGDNGDCVTTTTDASCVCKNGWTGPFCRTPADDWIIANRCYVYEPRVTAQDGVPVGCSKDSWECVPDNLQCFYYAGCDNPIGRCLPVDEEAFQNAVSQIVQATGGSKSGGNAPWWE